MDYFTPVKDCNVANKNHKTTTQTREGDWICHNCNNLNFSFRKKCNRCKTQTRQQNQMTETYSFYYYSKNYLYVPNTNPLKNSHHTATSINSKNISILNTPIILNDKQNKTPEKIYKQLPSVSPLVKKYNMREPKSGNSDEKSSSKGSVWGVAVRDFDDNLGGSGRSQQECRQQQQIGSDELQRMINNIIL